MGHGKCLQALATCPALCCQLFPQINGKTAGPLLCRLPDVATGPDRVHQPTRLGWDGTKQQGACLIRRSCTEIAIKNREALMIQAQQRWHKVHLTDTLS